MSNYSQITNFTPKDTLPTGNPSKVIKGSEFDGEFNAISVAVATKADSSTVSSLSTTVAGKQDTLVSGTNIKTVNGTSLLGSGNVAINTGDVVGPASATDNAIARFDGTTGKLVQGSGVVVDDSNNVGFGAAPSNLATNARSVEFGQRGVAWASTSASFTSYGTNATLGASNDWAYKETGVALAYVQSATGHEWRTAASGTAGAAMTLTTHMTLDTVGNLGLNKVPNAGFDYRETINVINGSVTGIQSRTYIFTASLTFTLPASPSAGDWVSVVNRSGTLTPVIARNGQNIMGLAEDMTLNSLNASLTLVYADATRGWVWV